MGDAIVSAGVQEALEKMRYDAFEEGRQQGFKEAIDQMRQTVDTMSISQTHPALLLETGIEELDFTVRTYGCLKREGVHTVGELLKQSEATLLRMRNFGAKSVDEVIANLATYGYKLSPSPAGFERE